MSQSAPMPTRHHLTAGRALRPLTSALLACGLMLAGSATWASSFPITNQQRDTAQRVAQAGVALSDLAPDAPDSYTVKPGDTLWDISRLFLKSPWRWPELWGMNLQQIANPHLIYPGQVLGLEKDGDRARLTVASPSPGGTNLNVTGDSGQALRISPRIRSEALMETPIDTVARERIQAFFHEAVLLSQDELTSAPRVVHAQDGRVILGSGDTAYVRGSVNSQSLYRVFREPRPLTDPITGELLGYEAVYVGTARAEAGGSGPSALRGGALEVASPVKILNARTEVGIGDRLSATLAAETGSFAPRAPGSPIEGEIVSVYGDSPQAGINQVVVLNRGQSHGLAPGHVLATWQAGKTVRDTRGSDRAALYIPDARSGMLLVFRTFDRLSYALVVSGQTALRRGDRVTQP
jgi:hypothetical protein